MNEVLARLLEELGWSPRTLARRVNADLGRTLIAETAPYHWRDHGRVPRAPLPALVAGVLSNEIGRRVTVDELWSGKARESSSIVLASDGTDLPWSAKGTSEAIDDWIQAGLLDRRTFLAVSGSSLSAAVAGYKATGKHLPQRHRGDSADAPLAQQVEQAIPVLQRLDDEGGGGRHLSYVGAQFRAVGLLVRDGDHDQSTRTRLLAALTELGQLAGWMAFDAGAHGLAQRYYFTSLRLAKDTGYDTMAAHIMADLAFQAATRERARDAVSMGVAAQELARSAPPAVTASVRTRLAYGYALAGDMDAFDAAYGSAVDALSNRARQEDPAWMYFLTKSHLDAQAGYALIHTGTLVNDPTSKKQLLRRGERLLRSGAHDRPLDSPSQRRALFEGAWLAVAAASRGDHEQADAIGRTALTRMSTVRSHRCSAVLMRLMATLRRARRNAFAASLMPDLDAALRRQNAAS